MSGVMSNFTRAIEKETDQVYFRRNTGYMVPGFLIAGLGVVGYVVGSVLFAPFVPPIVEIIIAGVLLLVFLLVRQLFLFVKGAAKLNLGLLPFAAGLLIMLYLIGSDIVSDRGMSFEGLSNLVNLPMA